MIVHAARLMLGATEPTQGWVEVNDDGIVRSVEAGVPPVPADRVLEHGYLVPGFVDLHCHGGGGGDFCSADETSVRRAAELHRRHGTSALVASLMSAPPEDLSRQIELLAGVIEAGDSVLRGIHLEGPFLAASRCGAQHPDHLLDPDPALLQEWVERSRGHLRMITVAPELPGAIELVEHAVDLGLVVAVGHTDADYDVVLDAFDAGATVATHLFNGMRDHHHRSPGPVGAVLDAGAMFELINDGIHLHASTVRLVTTARPDRAVLVTDAMAGAGAPPGHYLLGGQDVVVSEGAARLSRTNALAGSTLTMDRAVRFAVQAGLTPGQALRMAITQPAAALGGLTDAGPFTVGERTRLVHLADDFTVIGEIPVGQPGPLSRG